MYASVHVPKTQKKKNYKYCKDIHGLLLNVNNIPINQRLVETGHTNLF